MIYKKDILKKDQLINPHFKGYETIKNYIHQFEYAVKNFNIFLLEERITQSQVTEIELPK